MQKGEPFLISGFCCCPPVVRWLVPGLSLCLLKLQAIVYHPTNLTMAASRSQTSLSTVTALVSPVLPFSIAHKSLWVSVFPTLHYILFLCDDAGHRRSSLRSSSSVHSQVLKILTLNKCCKLYAHKRKRVKRYLEQIGKQIFHV